MNKKVDFNKYSDEYISIMNEQHAKYGDIEYYSEQKAGITFKIFANEVDSILEFGCGIGRNLASIKKKFPSVSIYGSDISDESLQVAKKNNPKVEFINDLELINCKEKFDLIFIAGVYHHIAPNLRDEVTKKIYTLLKPKGKLICFEHNPYNPLTRHMVNTCEFDKDAVLMNKNEVKNIFVKQHFKVIKGGYILFVPSKLKKLNFIETFLTWLPLGGQYYMAFEKN